MNDQLKQHPRGTFKSADGTIRCEGCHLHLDACTCNEDNAVRVIFAAAFDRDLMADNAP